MFPDALPLVLIILVALVFDFLNGFHDAANSIATVVSTRVLSPMQAVIWAAFFNFAAAFVFGIKGMQAFCIRGDVGKAKQNLIEQMRPTFREGDT
jgi:phosphate/sulfate permease